MQEIRNENKKARIHTIKDIFYVISYPLTKCTFLVIR